MTIDDPISAFLITSGHLRGGQEPSNLVGRRKRYDPNRPEHYADSVHFTYVDSVSMAHQLAQALISSAALQFVVANWPAQIEPAD